MSVNIVDIVFWVKTPYLDGVYHNGYLTLSGQNLTHEIVTEHLQLTLESNVFDITHIGSDQVTNYIEQTRLYPYKFSQLLKDLKQS